MVRARHGLYLAGIGAVVLLIGIDAPTLLAQKDYSDKDFSVRMASAFVRFTEVSTIGGETVANRFSSAINPASVGWFSLPGKLGVVAAPYYSNIRFDNGTRIDLMGESVTWDTKKWGAFQPTLSQIWTDNGHDRNGLSFDYSVDTAQLQWGKRFGDLGLGACFNFARASINRDGTIIQSIMGYPIPTHVDSDATAESYRWRFGGLYQPVEKLLTGMIFEYGFQPYRSKTLVTVPLPPPFPPMTTTTEDRGIQQQYIFRPGVSYEYAKMSTIYADYQYATYFNPRDQLICHRFNTGIEHCLMNCLFLRMGPSFDARGNVGISCGASLFLSKWCSMDIGYQYNMLPELQPEFGRANTIQAALAFRF